MKLNTERINSICEGLSEEDKEIFEALRKKEELDENDPLVRECRTIAQTKIAEGLSACAKFGVNMFPFWIVIESMIISGLRYGIRIGYAAAFDDQMGLEDDRPLESKSHD